MTIIMSLSRGETVMASVPDAFKCPITSELMADPVTTADGFSYEREAITRWFSSHATSPLTGAPLDHLLLVPNLALRSAIQEVVAQRPELRHSVYQKGAPTCAPSSNPLARGNSLTHSLAHEDFSNPATYTPSLYPCHLTNGCGPASRPARRARTAHTSLSARREIAERLEQETAEALRLEQSRSRRAELERSLREEAQARRQREEEEEEDAVLWAVFQSDQEEARRRRSAANAGSSAMPSERAQPSAPLTRNAPSSSLRASCMRLLGWGASSFRSAGECSRRRSAQESPRRAASHTARGSSAPRAPGHGAIYQVYYLTH